MITAYVNNFYNRSREQIRQKVLTALIDKGPCPATVLAYRAEMNDVQVQMAIAFLLQHKMVIKLPLNENNRIKLDLDFSLSTKDVIIITERGHEYLDILVRMSKLIDWGKFDTETSKRIKKK